MNELIPRGVSTISELRIDDKGNLVKIGRWNILDKIDRRVFHRKEQDSKVVEKIKSLLEKEGVNALKDPLSSTRYTLSSLRKSEINCLLKGKYGIVVLACPKKVDALFTSSVQSAQLDKQIQELEGKKLTYDEFPFLFELAHELEKYLEDPNAPNKKMYEQIFKERVQPKVKKAKEMLEKRPMHFSVKAAASKGKAAIASLKAKEALGKNLENQNANVNSRNQVTLLPEHGAVVKKMSQQSKEETILLDGLFDIYAKQAVVGTFGEIKPFVEMTLVSTLSSRAQSHVFSRLTQDDEYIAVLTGCLQMLDLHDANLGVAPRLPQGTSFSDFQVGNRAPKSAQQFVISYLRGTITDQTTVTFKENGILKTMQVRDLPKELKDCPFQLVLFDTDLSLAEDSRLQVQKRGGKREHLIPFRSCFLETDWKDKPLSKETIKRLLESGERESQAAKWMRRADAPIYQKLSRASKENVLSWITPKLEQYTLTNAREKNSYATLKSVREAFAKDLASENSPLWEELQKALPGLSREKIAEQLYPRATARQQNALLERQMSIKAYLTSYQELASYDGPKLIKKIEEFIRKPETPLTTVEKRKLLSMLADVKSDTQCRELQKILLENCIPTYFNIMKAIYPLLADVFELSTIAYGESFAGKMIGHFEYPIEKILAVIRNEHKGNKVAQELADSVQEKLSSIKDPSFFGEWG